MTRSSYRVAMLLVLVGLLASCHGQKPDEAPVRDRSDDEVYQLALRVSDQADAIVVIQNTEDVLGELEGLRAFDLVGSDVPPEAAGRILAGSVGFDPRNLRAWRSKGIRTNAPMLIVFSEDDPVVVLPIADAEQFNAFMEEQPWSYEGDPYPGRLYDSRVRARAEEKGQTTRGMPVWDVYDDVACVSLQRRRRDIDRSCIKPDAFSARSMAEYDEFLAFRDGPMRAASIGLFAPTYNAATVEEMVHDFSRDDSLSVVALMRALAELQGLSMTGRLEAGSLVARARVGLTDIGHQSLSELFSTPPTLDLNGVIPPNAVAALRVAVDPQTAWDWFRAALHWEQRETLRRNVDEVRDKLDGEFDVEADIIEQLGGELVLLVEPIPPKPAGSPQGGRPRGRHGYHRHALTDDGMAFSLLVSFADPVAPPRLLELIEELGTPSQPGSGSRVTLREGSEGITIAEFKSSYAPRIMVRGKRLIMAPSVLPVERVEQTLMAQHPRVKSEGSRRLVDSTGAAAGFFDFQAFFETVATKRAVEDLDGLAEQLEYAAGSVYLDAEALVAEGKLVDASMVRLIASVVIGDEVRQWSTRPHDQLREAARQASRYYSRYQGGCADVKSCPEPWHAGTPGRVDTDKRVFPGGPNVRVTTHRRPPIAGRRKKVAIDGTRFAEKTAQILGLSRRYASQFQYVYETNGVVGPGAEFSLEAIADLDPTSPEMHTFRITGRVLDSGRVQLSDVEEQHRFE